jgi:tRNA/tmRNA/rRNA uracil-C5-methylase (TrmA/RlmC/RlmD family)
VSSDSATTVDVHSNDVKSLAGSDYEILSIVPFDMFPQTKHCEVVVELRRK